MARRLSARLAVVAALLLGSLTAIPSTTQAGSTPSRPGAAVPVISWGPCEGPIDPTAQCATVPVPLDLLK